MSQHWDCAWPSLATRKKRNHRGKESNPLRLNEARLPIKGLVPKSVPPKSELFRKLLPRNQAARHRHRQRAEGHPGARHRHRQRAEGHPGAKHRHRQRVEARNRHKRQLLGPISCKDEQNYLRIFSNQIRRVNLSPLKASLLSYLVWIKTKTAVCLQKRCRQLHFLKNHTNHRMGRIYSPHSCFSMCWANDTPSNRYNARIGHLANR